MKDSYRELKKIAPELYQECVESAGAIAINNSLSFTINCQKDAPSLEVCMNGKNNEFFDKNKKSSVLFYNIVIYYIR